MKKFITIILIIILCVCFAGCEQQTSSNTENSLAERDDKIESLLTDSHFFKAKKIKQFETKGFSPSVENISVNDNIITFDIVIDGPEGISIKKENNTGTVAAYKYYETPADNIKVFWGDIELYENKITISDRKTVAQYSVIDGSLLQNISLETMTGEEDFYITDVTGYPYGWLLTYFKPGVDAKIYLTNQDISDIKYHRLNTFAPVKDREIEKVLSDSVYFRDSYSVDLTAIEDNILIFPHNDTVYDIQTKTGGSISFIINESTDNYKLIFFDHHYADKHYICLKTEDSFKSAYIPENDFLYIPYTKDITKLDIISDRTIKIYDNNNGFETLIDIEKGTVKTDVSQDITFSEYDLEEKSQDGAYSLHLKLTGGGGDGYSGIYVLKDNNTNQYKILKGTGGGTGYYSGGEDAGFMANGDIYVFSNNDFTIYEKGFPSSVPKFRLSDSFMKNANDNKGSTRVLFAARRNPEDFTYTVLYADEDNNTKVLEGQENLFHQKLNTTYKVGILDTNGNPIRIIDTKINVTDSPFGYPSVDMYMSDNNTLNFHAYQRGTIVEATVNLSTEQVTFKEAEQC